MATPVIERVLGRLDITDADECWLWPGSIRGTGVHTYGTVRVGSRTDGTRRVRATHIVVWEEVAGPVAAGLELDHLCRQPLCCNPAHLEPVTHAENMRRADWSGRTEELRAHAAWMRTRRWTAVA